MLTRFVSGSSNTTEALTVSLIRAEESIAKFSPEFTYAIFGEEEAVFGYKGLDISLLFASHDLQLHVDITWIEQWKPRGDIKASDVRGALLDFLPVSVFEESSRPKTLSAEEAADFTPPGKLQHEYGFGSDRFEIWCASLADPRARKLFENMQILVPLFIDGGTLLQLDNDWVAGRWNVFLVYEIHQDDSGNCPYSLIGFSTSYRVFTVPDDRNKFATPEHLSLLQTDEPDFMSFLESYSTSAKPMKSPLELPSRERISQFLILPPYQGTGHGSQLYSAMHYHLTLPSNVLELTVEDPNEEFDDMRDVCDLIYLRELFDDFPSLAINPDINTEKLKPNANIPIDEIVDTKHIADVAKRSKIMPRQLWRLIEMHTLDKIPPNHRSMNRITRKNQSSSAMDRSYFYWRLLVKHRLYRTNSQTLDELDTADRIEKLETTVNNVQDDYVRLLALTEHRLGAREKRQEAERAERLKRKNFFGPGPFDVPDDDDDEDEDEDEDEDSERPIIMAADDLTGVELLDMDKTLAQRFSANKRRRIVME